MCIGSASTGAPLDGQTCARRLRSHAIAASSDQAAQLATLNLAVAEWGARARARLNGATRACGFPVEPAGAHARLTKAINRPQVRARAPPVAAALVKGKRACFNGARAAV